MSVFGLVQAHVVSVPISVPGEPAPSVVRAANKALKEADAHPPALSCLLTILSLRQLLQSFRDVTAVPNSPSESGMHF